MFIGTKEITSNTPVYFIAEISANHCNDKRIAHQIIEECARAGADAVKFQTYTAKELAADGISIKRGLDRKHDAWLASIGGRDTLQDLLSGGGLPREWHKEMKSVADWNGIEFLSTPFSVDAAKFLVEEIGVKALKIASGDLTFKPLLEYANKCGLPVILSTGGAYLTEVVDAVHFEMLEAYQAGRIAVLHCTSSYPLNPRDANLGAIRTLLAQSYNTIVGYSDHTTNIDWLPVMAVTLGARIYEKHVKLGTGIGSIDRDHSITTEDLKDMIKNVDDSVAAMGDGRKVPQPSELHDRIWARRDPSDWLRPTQRAREGAWE